MEGKKKDVKAGVVQTVQNVVGSSAKQSPNVGGLCMMLLVVLRVFFFESMWHSSAWQVKWTTSTCVTVWIHSRCPQGGQRQHPRSQFLNACVFRQHGRSIATTWILDVVTKKTSELAGRLFCSCCFVFRKVFRLLQPSAAAFSRPRGPSG